jgi:glycosyltransferase involved in cell wall biosynthesis
MTSKLLIRHHCMSDRKTKVILIQNVVAPYRIPLFKLIGGSSELDFAVLLTSPYCKHRPHWNWTLSDLPFKCKALRGFSWAKNEAKTYFFSPTLFFHLVASRPDVVVASGFSFATAMVACYTMLFRKKNLIWCEATQVTEARVSRPKTLFRKFLARFASGFIDAGQLSRAYLKGLIPDHDQRPFFHAYNGVETDRFANFPRPDVTELGLHPDRKKILFVGRLNENKNVRTLLKAYESLMKQCPEQLPQLVIVGEGPLERLASSKASELGTQNVVLAGNVDYEKMPAYYHSCDVFILLSYSDCNPLVILEALSVGVPIVCTSRAGNAVDFVHEGCNGYIVEPDAEVQIARRLREVLSWSPEKRSSVAQVSKDLIKKTSYESVSDTFISAIKSTL